MITFGRIGNVDEETDRKDFFQNLEFFMNCLTGFIYKYDTFTEIEIIEKIKKKIKGFDPKQKPSFFGDRIPYCINFFLRYMGMSYYTLTLKEKEEILVMDFTYENWKEKSIKIINNYIERSKNVCPDEIDFCFDDICFVFYVQINHGCEFTLNNFLTFIRDYFILDKSKSLFEQYRNAKIYEDIQRKVINIYPNLKKRYGKNIYLEKILSFISSDTDYNYEETKKILDNNKKFNNKIKDDETIKLKDKQD